jgi:Holliday junction resolvase
MVNYKKKGIDAERQLLSMFWDNEWVAIRVAGSGSMRHPSPDLLTSNGERILCIEVKVTSSECQYFSKKEIEELKFFSSKFKAEPWTCVKFKNKEWFFFILEDLHENEKQFRISLKDAQLKGIKFEEIIKF